MFLRVDLAFVIGGFLLFLGLVKRSLLVQLNPAIPDPRVTEIRQ